MLSRYKPQFEHYLQGLAKSLSWINPNTLTLIGIIPQVLFFIFMRDGHFVWAAVALLANTIDMLDGMVARINNKVTAFGGFLDSTVDRISDFIILSAFYAGGLVSLRLTAILILTTFLISYVRSRAELASKEWIKFDIGLIERPERILFLFLTLILYILFPTIQFGGSSLVELLIQLLTLLSVITLLQRVLYAYKKL